MDMKLEVVVIPVSDVDRAKEFYGRLGFREDIDCVAPDGQHRQPVQGEQRLTALGSA